MATVNGGSTTDYTDTTLYPVWKDDGVNDVESLFRNPYFVPDQPEGNRKKVGQLWYDGMKDCWAGQIRLFDIDGQDPNNVYDNGPSIHTKLSPGESMPYDVDGYKGKFPPEALERFRLWYNQGGRQHKKDDYPGKLQPNPVIPDNTPKVRDFKVSDQPVWDATGTDEDDIKMAFTNPCWIQGGETVAKTWREAMLNFQFDAGDSVDSVVYLDLQNYEHVKWSARSIYNHVASKSMPIQEPTWSDNACEAFRRWYNLGCPQDKSKIGHVHKPSGNDIISAEPVEPPFRVRKDINTLTDDELRTYRMKLLNLKPFQINDSVWQTGGFLHANWCLHYMQASFPWHRAHLLWLENQIDFPIPYWNFFSSQASNTDSLDSGIPEAFLAYEFLGDDGQVYLNPLRRALARGGRSRADKDDSAPHEEVHRKKELMIWDKKDADRVAYIKQYVPGHLEQIHAAMNMNDLGDPHTTGNIFVWDVKDRAKDDPRKLNDLGPDNDKAFYDSVKDDFDGVLEQAHDNIHGWCGPDMANNSYAAFDPLFWSFHSNFDRLFETWIRAHDKTQDWSSNFPLRPFIGRDGNITAAEGEKFTYRYTTIGNMVINSKALGYTFAPPGNPDYDPPAHKISLEKAPIVFFKAACTDRTAIIHVALNPNKDDKPLEIGAPGYVGSITRLGMGPDNGNNRCISGYVLRRLEATKAMNDLGGLTLDAEVPLKLLVLEDNHGVQHEVPESEYSKWPGFVPRVVWANPAGGVVAH